MLWWFHGCSLFFLVIVPNFVKIKSVSSRELSMPLELTIGFPATISRGFSRILRGRNEGKSLLTWKKEFRVLLWVRANQCSLACHPFFHKIWDKTFFCWNISCIQNHHLSTFSFPMGWLWNYLVIASPRLAINKLQDIVTQGLLRQSFHKKWSFGGRAAVAEASLLLLNDLAKSQTPSRWCFSDFHRLAAESNFFTVTYLSYLCNFFLFLRPVIQPFLRKESCRK